MAESFLITPDCAAEAAEALAQAFLDESTTTFFFPPEEGPKIEKLRMLFGWAVEYRMQTGLPVLGVEGPDGTVVGVATIMTPNPAGVEDVVDRTWSSLAEQLGEAASRRIEAYDSLQERHVLKEPHHYVVAVGVHPDFHGKGYGGALLRGAIELAEADPDSRGIGLDTSSESNQRFYEKYGFELISAADLGGKLVRFMFRPKST